LSVSSGCEPEFRSLWNPGGVLMAKYECMQCGWTGKPMVMEPATKVCPKCGSVRLNKLRKDQE
jgi:DNA-directed RNA polymerase subunit RPC12/RpoP